MAKRSRYLQEKEDAVKRQMRQLGRIRDSLNFYQDRLQDFVNLGTGKIAEEELDEEELKLIKFQHGVALTPITYGPRYGGMVGDFEKPVITNFFLRSSPKVKATASSLAAAIYTFMKKWTMTG